MSRMHIYPTPIIDFSLLKLLLKQEPFGCFLEEYMYLYSLRSANMFLKILYKLSTLDTINDSK